MNGKINTLGVRVMPHGDCSRTHAFLAFFLIFCISHEKRHKSTVTALESLKWLSTPPVHCLSLTLWSPQSLYHSLSGHYSSLSSLCHGPQYGINFPKDFHCDGFTRHANRELTFTNLAIHLFEVVWYEKFWKHDSQNSGTLVKYVSDLNSSHVHTKLLPLSVLLRYTYLSSSIMIKWLRCFYFLILYTSNSTFLKHELNLFSEDINNYTCDTTLFVLEFLFSSGASATKNRCHPANLRHDHQLNLYAACYCRRLIYHVR